MQSSFLKSCVLLLLAVAVSSTSVFGQVQDLDGTNTLNYYQIQNARINFFRVDNRYQILPDTMYFIDRPAFIINIGYDSIQWKGEWYIILTYPDYTGSNVRRLEPADPANGSHQEGQSDTSYIQPKSKTAGNTPAADSTNTLDITTHQADAVVQPKSTDTANWVRVRLNGLNGARLCIKKSDFQKLTLVPIYSIAWKHVVFSSGQLTVPFKLRPGTGGKNFSMTTDVTLGAYAGLKKRISKKQPYFLTLPIVLGLTFINTENNTTTTSSPSDAGSTVYPGWTVATGLIAQFGTFNIGIVTGWDFASQVGKTWIYQGKNWFSFGIGYSFLK